MKTRCFIKWVGMTLTACMALYASACSDEELIGAPTEAASEPTPVRFEVSCAPLAEPGGAATRSKPADKTWKDGETLQITATFTGTKDWDSSEANQYSYYKYSEADDEWVAEGIGLYWPTGATNGTFTAYYLTGLNGIITTSDERPENSTGNYLLSAIAEGEDPLYCTTTKKYGRSINLQFEHLCTHLTLQDVKQNIADTYWLYRDSAEIPNAYKLTYNRNDNKLIFEFVCSDANQTDSHHYFVSRKRQSSESSSWVDFYLAPSDRANGETRDATDKTDKRYGYGKGCKLNYYNDHPYLSFTSEELDTLQAGYHYELSINRYMGIVPESPESFPDKPTENDAYVDIPELLAGIRDKKDVRDANSQLVLKAEGEEVPHLLRDVDFYNFNPIDYVNGTGMFDQNAESPVVPENRRGPHPNWKMPSLNSVILDGDFHSFIHVAYPIFFEIESGEIYNLAIRQSKVEITVDDIKAMNDLEIQGNTTHGTLNSDFGILCCFFNGLLSNFLLEEVEMIVHFDERCIPNDYAANIDFNMGCITARQTTTNMANAKIENVQLRGEVKLTVETDEDHKATAVQDAFVGILAGQSGARIEGVTCEKGLTARGEEKDGVCKVSVPIKGDNTVTVGGLVGQEVMEAKEINVNVEVNASKLDVNQCYVGGVFGVIVNQSESKGVVNNCTASVTVTGGISHPINSATYAYSYCGGIAGKMDSGELDRIDITGSVKGGTEPAAQANNTMMMVYATGGGFGYVTANNDTTVMNCRALATVSPAQLQTTNVTVNATGRFAGMSPLDLQEGAPNNCWARRDGSFEFVGEKKSEPSPAGGVELTDAQ